MSASGARQWRLPCDVCYPDGETRPTHSQVSARNLAYFISEARVPDALDEAQLRDLFETHAGGDGQALVACNGCRSVRAVDGSEVQTLAYGSAPDRSPGIQASQRFRCVGCGAEQVLPESPTDGAQRVRVGCGECGRPTAHLAVGRAIEGKQVFDQARREPGLLAADGGEAGG